MQYWRALGNSASLQIARFSRQDFPPKTGSGGQVNRLNSRFFQRAERLPSARVAASGPSIQYHKPLPTSPQSSRTWGCIPLTTGRKSVMGSFRRVYWQTARECGSVAISRGRGITKILRICTLAMGVPQRFRGAGAGSSPGFQHGGNPRIRRAKKGGSTPFASTSRN